MGNCCSAKNAVTAKSKGVLSFSDVNNPVRRTKSRRHMQPVSQRPPFCLCYELGKKLGEGSYSTVHRGKQILAPGELMNSLPDVRSKSGSFTLPAEPPNDGGDGKREREVDESSNDGDDDGPMKLSTMKRDSTYDEGHNFAIKIVDKRKLCRADLKALASEVHILRELRHDNIVHLYEVFDEVPVCYLVTELCSGGELFDRIVRQSRYTEADARLAVLQILNGIAFLHSHDVVHRDIKPENLLYDKPGNSVLKIADFGFAHYEASLADETDVCGTPSYIAPEVLEGRHFNHLVDVWSVGIEDLPPPEMRAHR